MAQDIRILGGRNNTSVLVTDQQELLVRINSADSSVAGATEATVALALLPSSDPAANPNFTESIDYAVSGVIKAAPGTFYSISGYNSNSSPQFIHLYDSITVPADTEIPRIILKVEAEKNFYYDSGRFGISFSTGISWSNSTTAVTKTEGVADIWLNAQFK